MSISHAAPPDNGTDESAPCPDWCAERGNHPWNRDAIDPTDVFRFHERQVGKFVAVQGYEHKGNRMTVGVDVYLGSDDAISAATARQLAADLVSAADIVESQQ